MLAGERQRETAGAARQRLRRDEHARGVAAFDGALHPQPRRERERRSAVAGTSARSMATTAEPARLQHEVERLERAIDGPSTVQPRPTFRARRGCKPRRRWRRSRPRIHNTRLKIGAGRLGRGHVEPIEGVHERHQLAAARGGGHHLQQQRRAARRARPGEFRQLAPRHASAQAGVEDGHARRRAGILACSSGGSAVVSVRSSLRSRSADSRTASAEFAIYSPHQKGEYIAKIATEIKRCNPLRSERFRDPRARVLDAARRFARSIPAGARRTSARHRLSPHRRGAHLPRLPRAVDRRVHLDHRHLDAEGGAELARAHARRLVVGLLPRASIRFSASCRSCSSRSSAASWPIAATAGSCC